MNYVNRYRRRSLNRVDKRKVGWIRIPHPIYCGNSDKDVSKYTNLLDAIQLHNPSLYAKVMHKHLIEDPIKNKAELLNLKYPPVKPEPEPE